jgi:glutamyl-tRNA synthetase
MDFEEIVRAYTLLNAAKYKGTANAKAVLGQIFGRYPEARDKKDEIFALVNATVKEVNTLALEAINTAIAKLPEEFIEEKRPEEPKELPPLPNSDKPVVMRLAPYPSGPLHIGNSRMVILNDYYVKRYKGKLFLVFDDTIGSEEKVIVPDAYDMIVESLDWLGVKYDKIIYKSDRIDQTYTWCKKAIEKGIAYVCTCDAEGWRNNFKIKGTPCPHRNQSIATNLEEWAKMLGGAYEDRQAVARLKIGMDNPNPAIRDPVIMRIAKRAHPRVGTKFIVWPLLEFSWAIDDHLLGITHILRGKDLIKEDVIEQWVWEKFGWPIIAFIHYGLIKFEGLKLSKTQSRLNIESKTYHGWGDPRTWSLQSLQKRGFEPAALIEAMKSLGLSKVDIEYSPLALYSINKKFIDPIALRYFFIPNPVKILIKNIPFSQIEAHPLAHPEHPEKGKRTISLPVSQGSAEVFIPSAETNLLKKGTIVRLKDLFNIKITSQKEPVSAEFYSKALEDAREMNLPIIQWVPCSDNVGIQVVMPEGDSIEGLGEPACRQLEMNQIIQFERFGFGKVNQKEPSIIVYFAHK